MIINAHNLSVLFTTFSAVFKKGLETAPLHYREIAMVTTSQTSENIYQWLGAFPKLREWIGDRAIFGIKSHDFTIKNKEFESTIAVPRVALEDDRYGVYGPILTEMGLAAGEHPNEMVFSLLASGFTALCYDGKPFFAADHKVGDDANGPPVQDVSNMQAGSDPAWYLLDTTRAIKPLVWQERIAPVLTSKTNEGDDNVFFDREYLYGTRTRGAAGFGLWQLAFGSKAPLNAENYEAARAAMMGLKGDTGRPLNIKPTVLVCPPALEGAAMRLLNNGTRIEVVEEVPVSVQNEWANTAKPIVTAWAQ